MQKHIGARLAAAALAALALLSACSAAPDREASSQTAEAITTHSCTAAFESWQCTYEGLGGTRLCGCQGLSGATCQVDDEICPTVTVAPPPGLGACTTGLTFRFDPAVATDMWICPSSVTLPAGIIAANHSDWCSNCLGAAPPGFTYVARSSEPPPGLEPGSNCPGSCKVIGH